MSDSIPPFEYLERYRNKGTRTYSRHSAYTEADDRYRPDSTHDHFALEIHMVPADHVNVYLANPTQTLRENYLQTDEVSMCIHPQMLEMCPDDPYLRQVLRNARSCTTIRVRPSSSTRTLLVDDPTSPHALKVHFPFRVSRYTRKMRDEVIEQAVTVSQELETGVCQLDEDFGFFREVLGIAFKNLEPDSPRGENWGYLIRDMIPFPRIDLEEILVPGFALYGEDYFDPEVPPLLIDLIDERDPVDYVLNQIMLPILRHWIGCFRRFGYLLEPHGQNVILAMDHEHTTRRIIHRDLNVGIDMRRREIVGLSPEGLNSYNQIGPLAFHSITYDRFMGGHFFDRLVSVCQSLDPNLAKEEFTGPCCDEFVRIFPEYGDYFPRTVWYFSEDRDEFGKPLHQDTGALPEWRPS